MRLALPWGSILASMIVGMVSIVHSAMGNDGAAICPKETIRLFNGKNLDGLYTWLKDSKYEDPRRVFSVESGMIHISGDGMGYVATKDRYKNYRLIVEYRWGDRTWSWRKTFAKDSGIIVHCAEPDGSYEGIFMGGIEAQIIEGGTGDFWVVPGKQASGNAIPLSLSVAGKESPNGKLTWAADSPHTTICPKSPNPINVNWFAKDPNWKETLGCRGSRDVESPGKQWTRLEVICDGGHIQYFVNDVLANEGFEAQPASGKILIQSELAEIYIRRFELLPLDTKANHFQHKGNTP